MTHTTDYKNAFISVAADCRAAAGTIPPEKRVPTVARAQYDMIAAHPYRHRSDDILFSIWAKRQGIAAGGLKKAREAFFSKGQPCLRASALGKTYGWGLHFDEQGRVALFGVESKDYRKFANDPGLKQLSAMRGGG